MFASELLWYGDENVATSLQYRSIQGRSKELHYEVDGYYVKPSEWKNFEHGCISVVNGKEGVEGTRPKMFNALDKPELKDRVHTLQTIEDFRRIDAALRSSKTIAIIGEGILASELAYSIQRRYRKTGEPKVVQIFEEDDVLHQILPSRLREDASKQIFKQGVRLMNNSTIQSAEAKAGGGIQLLVRRGDGRKEQVDVDHVIVAIGAEPNVDLAHASDLKLDSKNGGILVDEEFRASSDVFSAGDVSSFNDLKLGRRRIEHVEHAEISGRVAGENMSGGKRTYPRQASWRSTVGPDVHFIGLGKVDAAMKTVVVAAQKDEVCVSRSIRNSKAVAFYLENDKVVGILLYNVFEDGILMARKLLSDGVNASQIPELARLFHLYPSDKEQEEEGEQTDAPTDGSAKGEQEAEKIPI
ncbi:Apoptosis-inducing factor 1, mitochondrial [Aphelenchoides fujianensis]|nr:Apoptosis-inducing factor 1, mitochondrial [Aphelenchoides fujianensis]